MSGMSELALKQQPQRAPDDGPAGAVPAVVSDATSLMAVISRAASDPAVDVDKLGRLLSMYERITAAGARANYTSALALMQPELPVIGRRGLIEVRAKGSTGERDGKVQQSTPYALWEDINDAIRPVLAKYGFALSFRIGMAEDGRIKVTGVLSHRDGHQEETTMLLPHDSTGSKNAVQAIGSSTQYGKRYTAAALLNLTSRGEDDDGVMAGAMRITDAQMDSLNILADTVKADKRAFCAFMGVDSIADIPARDYRKAEEALKAKARKTGATA